MYLSCMEFSLHGQWHLHLKCLLQWHSCGQWAHRNMSCCSAWDESFDTGECPSWRRIDCSTIALWCSSDHICQISDIIMIVYRKYMWHFIPKWNGLTTWKIECISYCRVHSPYVVCNENESCFHKYKPDQSYKCIFQLTYHFWVNKYIEKKLIWHWD